MKTPKRTPRTAATTKQPRWLRELVGFGSATALDQGARLASNLVIAGLLGPTAWGIWFLLSLVLQYGSMVHLGALNGMNREIPSALGRADADAADQVRATTLGVVFASYVVGAALLGAVLVPLGVVPGGALAWLMIALLASQQLATFAFMNLRARTEFMAAARLQFVSAFAYPLATIPLSQAWGLEGFLAGQIAWFLLLAALAALRSPGLFRPRFSWAAARPLIAIGFPIMLIGVIHTVFATVDRWVIQANLGPTSLGHYAIAIMALGAIGLLPRVVSQQVYPRMAMAWARDRHWRTLEPLMARQRWMALAISAPAALFVALVAPWAIRAFLPAYEPGIPALVVSMLIPLVKVPGAGYGNAFNVVGLQHWYLTSLAIATVANVGASVALVGPYGLAGVATGTVIGYAVFAVVMMLAGVRARRTAPRGPGHHDVAQR